MVAEEITDETPQDDIEENENLMQEDEPATDEPAPEQLPPPPKAGLHLKRTPGRCWPTSASC
jgi:hypothetical protein